jgi:Ser/Thr protein kinase RdoA (MazF antagonist)
MDAADIDVAVPTPIGWSRERGLLVLEAMPGMRWADLDPRGPTARAALGRLGAAIATFHAVGPQPTTSATTPRDDLLGLPEFGRLRLERVGHSAELVAQARPDLAASAFRLRSALAAGSPAGDDRVLLHGDCHPKNALLDGDRIVLVDLDQSGWGSPAADLGSLVARLHQDAVADGTPGAAADVGALIALVLDGYASVRPLPSEASLRWHTVAAIVAERAVRAVNRVNEPALERLEELLAVAEHIHREGVSR